MKNQTECHLKHSLGFQRKKRFKPSTMIDQLFVQLLRLVAFVISNAIETNRYTTTEEFGKLATKRSQNNSFFHL